MRHPLHPRGRGRSRRAQMGSAASAVRRSSLCVPSLLLPRGSGRASSYLCASRAVLARMEARLAAFWRPAIAWWMAPC